MINYPLSIYRYFNLFQKPELYRNELIRQESVESSQESDTESAGTLSYSLKYDSEIEGLIVKVRTIFHAKSYVTVEISLVKEISSSERFWKYLTMHKNLWKEYVDI